MTNRERTVQECIQARAEGFTSSDSQKINKGHVNTNLARRPKFGSIIVCQQKSK